jgi:hypothetical protein
MSVTNNKLCLTYTPAPGKTGQDSICVIVCDQTGKCDTLKLPVTIVPLTNEPPIAINDVAITNVNKPVTGNILTNDRDPEASPLIVITAPITVPTKGYVIINSDGSYTFTPNPGAVGNDAFCYAISDVKGLKDTACVIITIVPNLSPTVNNQPIAVDDNTKTYQGVPVLINIVANDKDPDLLPLNNPTKLTNPTNGNVIINGDGTVTYTPKAGFTGMDSFTYSICDTGVPSKCDTATVNIAVLPISAAGNKPPIAIDDFVITTVGTIVNGNAKLNDNDPDPNTILTYSKLTEPSHGTVSMTADGKYIYTPTSGYSGGDNFTYQVCDNGLPSRCEVATVSILIIEGKNVVSLLPKVYLQGSLFGVTSPNMLMRDDLRVKKLIPFKNPYTAMGFAELTAADTVSQAVLNVTGANAIVDWVFVELRDATDPTIIKDSRAALLQRDGDIVTTDGINPILFSQVSQASYYVAVKHRNHLGVMTKTAIPLELTPAVVDFRLPSTPTFTLTNTGISQAQVVVDQGVAMWAGNSLHDTNVIYQGSGNDVNTVYQQVINFTGNVFVSPYYKLKGYYTGDINMNGETIFQGSGNDLEFIYQNIIKNHPGNVLKQNFFIIKQQLP